MIAILFGAVTFILGILYQLLILWKTDKRLVVKGFGILFLTRILSIVSTLLIWANWPFTFDILFGPIFFPSFVSELILSPLILKLFGYHISTNSKTIT